MSRVHTSPYFKKEGRGGICTLCPHHCHLSEGQTGICGVRQSSGGEIISLNYGRISAASMDPIEKKPLYHFYPGKQIYSIGTYGCNLKCPYCQNWSISQQVLNGKEQSPAQIVDEACSMGSFAIAYTYSEPLVWIEYVEDAARLAGERGLKNVLVTNGFCDTGPFEKLLDLIDACNIDLKTFNDKTYRTFQKGALGPVLSNIQIARQKCHVELTTLVVPGINDSMEEMEALVSWIAELDPQIPWHVSRYFPAYKYQAEPTSTALLLDIYEMAKQKLSHVYLGNIAGHEHTGRTYCSKCNEILIDRNRYSTKILSLSDGKCINCGHPLEGCFL